MNPIIEIALERACRNAAEVMGGDLKRMSCFISNWVVPENEISEEAEFDLAA